MKITIFVLAVFVGAAVARPQNIPIVTQTGVQDEAGQYAFSYSTGNGISAVEQGALKPNAARTANFITKQITAIWPITDRAPDGKTYTTVYTSDENGFQASGDHLPRDENSA